MASKTQKALEQKQLQLYDMMMQDIQRQRQPDPNLERLKSGYNKILDWYDPKQYKDIYSHPTLAAEISPLKIALGDRDANRVGTGFLGTSGTASAYAKDMALDRNFKRRLAGAEMIENALRGEKDKAEGGLAGLAGADLSRMNSTNSLMSQYSDALGGKIKELQSRGGFWKGVLGGLLGGVRFTAKGLTV